MITPEQKKESVLRQYFLQYLPTIKRSIYLFRHLTEQNPNGDLNLPHSMFLFSVIDYFGKIMRVANNPTKNKNQIGKVRENFIFFVEHCFASDSCKGDLLYELFRNGVMHQFFPKASSIYYSNCFTQRTILIDEYNNLPRLNLFTLSSLIESALNDIETKLTDDQINNIHSSLIESNYGFNDFDELNSLKAKYQAQNRTFYD